MNTFHLRSTVLMLFAALTTTLFADTYTAETVPNPKANGENGFLCNPDGVIEPAYVDMIGNLCSKIEEECAMDITVVALDSIDTNIHTFSTTLSELWSDEENDDIFVVLCKSNHEATIQAGTAIPFSEEEVSAIIYTFMEPACKRNACGESVMHGLLRIYAEGKKAQASLEETAEETNEETNHYYDDEDEYSWWDIIFGGSAMFFLVLLPFLLMVLYQGKKQKAGDELEQRDGCLGALIIGCIFMPWLIPTTIWFGIVAKKVRCPECGKRKMVKTGETITKEATYSSSGTKQIECECKACGHKEKYTTVVPKLTHSSSGSSSGGSSGGYSGGGGSWGGGSSGGGGASGSW